MANFLEYLVVYGKVGDEFEAYAPDIPDCVVRGKTREDVERKIRMAVSHQLYMLRLDQEHPPPAQSWSETIRIEIK